MPAQPIARLSAYRRSGFAAVTVYRNGRVRRYRVSLSRYRRLRLWAEGYASYYGAREKDQPFWVSGCWLRHGIDLSFWAPEMSPTHIAQLAA